MASSPATATSRLNFSLACLAIAANSLTAGGVFMFPILSPTFASVLKFSQPQLTAVSVAGLIGQYPFSPLVGKLLDLYGPQTCSIIAGVLFFVGFSSTALELTIAPSDLAQPSMFTFCRLTFLFLMAGLATVFSYFSSIFAATRMMPNRPGLASGSSMAVFGLSPLFLSTLSLFFTDPSTGSLKAVPFLTFLALVTITTHVFGMFVYQSLAVDTAPIAADEERVDENTSLLPRKLPEEPGIGAFPNPLGDWSFWLLGFYCLCVIGACEMIISNLGTVVMSLPAGTFSITMVSTSPASQVKILSMANTMSRLIIGPLADYLSPVLSGGMVRSVRKVQVSRVVFLTASAFFLVAAFLWMELYVHSRDRLWMLSVCVGISYGGIFAVLPSIVSAIWGAADLGRNFGIMTYAPFIGTPLFSTLYAYISAVHSEGAGICQGTSCWRTTFWVSCATSVLALCTSVILWRHWRDRL